MKTNLSDFYRASARYLSNPLTRRRKVMGITQSQLARLAGVDRKIISELERTPLPPFSITDETANRILYTAFSPPLTQQEEADKQKLSDFLRIQYISAGE